ncbi:alpha-glucosidase family protein [Paracoccus tibetensis]|uniref:Alpha-glucosidase n=1 Tax=Paracoccus tibetensis TaxID=336292 RepID=A0A1G5EUC8_9RHOB|nr:alpha-glucosidase family protein [Paracoccus tibetensis]SCY30567.1 alpha-glucosidase [Paracoccus tibetensis]
MQEWWRDAVIYQIYPRSFQDSNGDGIGDLIGITRRLDHVASLGVDAIWLSPIFTSPMKDMGYDVADYTGIDPLFGTMEDFDAMVARAHELGLKVIIDQVLSHSSDQHPWFAESRASREGDKADWYVWADPKPDGTPPNNWLSVFGGPAWEWEPRRRQYYLHNFLTEQPDLNLWNPAVQDALLDTMRFWLERGVDGFRLDTVNYYFHHGDLRDNPPNPDYRGPDAYSWQRHVESRNQPDNIAFLKRMRALTDEYEGRMMVGEVGDQGETGIRIMAEYTSGGDKLHMCYSFEMLGRTFTAAHFRRCIEEVQNSAADGHSCWSFSNHDVVRHVTRWQTETSDPDRLARLSAAMLLSFPGTICLYQGEELALPETVMERHELTDPPALRYWPEIKGRDGCRTPMPWDAQAPQGGFTDAAPWLPVKAPQLDRAVSTQGGEDSTLAAYRRLIAFRKAQEPLGHGTTEFLDLSEPILAFRRRKGDEVLTCVFNLGETPVTLQADSAELLDPSDAEASHGTLTLRGHGFAWLQGAPALSA